VLAEAYPLLRRETRLTRSSYCVAYFSFFFVPHWRALCSAFCVCVCTGEHLPRRRDCAADRHPARADAVPHRVAAGPRAGAVALAAHCCRGRRRAWRAARALRALWRRPDRHGLPVGQRAPPVWPVFQRDAGVARHGRRSAAARRRRPHGRRAPDRRLGDGRDRGDGAQVPLGPRVRL
jgi:hypothetical protein